MPTPFLMALDQVPQTELGENLTSSSRQILIPRTSAWTLRQRRLIIAGVLFAFVLFGALIYGYERYHRGPSESVLYGTWQDTTPAMDTVSYFQFRPDHTLLFLVDGLGDLRVMAKGRWYAGGEKIYFWVRFPDSEDPSPHLVVWHIEDIQPNEMSVRLGDYAPNRFIRVNLDLPPEA